MKSSDERMANTIIQNTIVMMITRPLAQEQSEREINKSETKKKRS